MSFTQFREQTELGAQHWRRSTCGLAAGEGREEEFVLKLLLFFILLVLCWPLALLAIVLYALTWLVLLPFRVAGVAVGGVFQLIGVLFMPPGRALRQR